MVLRRGALSVLPGGAPPPPPPWHAQLTSVGVTGTNGKTTTTRYLAALLGWFGAPVPSATTLGFCIGTTPLDLEPGYPGFIETFRRGHAMGARHAVLELTSEALARGFIAAWPCQLGVFTQLTRDHLDSHGSAEHYLASKAQLFVQLPPGGHAVLNAADPASLLLSEITPPSVERLWYASETRGRLACPAQLEAQAVRVGWDGTRARLLYRQGARRLEGELRLRALGAVYVENALAALAGALALGVPWEAALELLAEAAPVAGRAQLVCQSPHVVVDFAHTPDALARCVGSLRALCAGRLIVVFGAGGERDRPKRPLMGAAASRADHIILTSDNPRSEAPAAIASEIRDGIEPGPQVEVVLDRAAAIARAVTLAAPEDVVLIAGKGHELTQALGGRVQPFSDVAQVEAALRRH